MRIKRRDFVKAVGATGIAGLAGCMHEGDGTGDGGDGTAEGPDVLNVIGYPQSGITIFNDFYTNFPDAAEIIVPDGLRDPELPSQVGHSMDNLVGTAPAAAGPNQDAFNELYSDEYDEEPGVFTSNTYDAVSVLILANAAAGENTGSAVRDQMRRVANPPGDTYGPGEIAQAAEAAANGEDINYEGASSTVDFDERGDPASAAYDIWEFVEDEEAEAGYSTEVLDTVQFEGEGGGDMADEAPGGLGRTIMVGILLPRTGDLGPLGNPMINAAQLPIQEVNQSDVDLDVQSSVQDSQTNQSAAISGANSLVNAGYPAICGPAGSGQNGPVSEDVYIPNQVVGCSPSSTALSVSFFEDDDYIFRTAPSDLLQGQVMAQVAAERLDADTASTFFVNNDYGQQLSEQFSTTFQEDHDGEIYQQVSFEGEQSSYTSKLQQALSPP